MNYKGISGFYCFGSQSESREMFFIGRLLGLGSLDLIFFRTKTPEMNVSESVHMGFKKLK